MGIGEQALFIHKQKLVFAGQSFGYYTKFQNSTYEVTAPTRDIYLWKLDTGNVDQCFYNDDITASTLNSRDYWTLDSYYTARKSYASDWSKISRGGTGSW